MGGSSSKFEETNWDRADGKLTSSEQTIDNAPPTDSFRVYYLTKLGVNQREYKVADSESNILYYTRAVEGTLAWFDVLGPGGDDDRLLRVQVDLSRRYWVIYRYGTPTFTGQMWDEEASERVSYRDGWRKPLFRRACITVSWARYHAVVDFYEPAVPQEQTDGNVVDDHNHAENKDVNIGEEKKTENGACQESGGPSNVDAGRNISFERDECIVNEEETCRDYGDDHQLEASPDIYVDEVENESNDSRVEDAVKSECSVLDSNDDEPFGSEPIAFPQDTSATSTTGEEEAVTPVAPLSSENTERPTVDERASTLGASIRWMQSKAMQSVAAPYRPENEEEGVITLNNPALKVQEINSIVGQHQTMLIREKEAQKLKCEELLTEAELAREAQTGITTEADNDWASDDAILNDLWYKYSYTSVVGDSVEVSTSDENDGPASTIVNVLSDSCLFISPSKDETKASIGASSTDGNTDEEPLVGFWSWENSLTVHRMKMHLAAGSDLALHVVLAVVTNQLRYERHATVAVAL